MVSFPVRKVCLKTPSEVCTVKKMELFCFLVKRAADEVSSEAKKPRIEVTADSCLVYRLLHMMVGSRTVCF